MASLRKICYFTLFPLLATVGAWLSIRTLPVLDNLTVALIAAVEDGSIGIIASRLLKDVGSWCSFGHLCLVLLAIISLTFALRRAKVATHTIHRQVKFDLLNFSITCFRFEVFRDILLVQFLFKVEIGCADISHRRQIILLLLIFKKIFQTLKMNAISLIIENKLT